MRGTLYLAPPRPKQATPHPPAAPSPLSRRGEGSRRRRPFFSRTRECANETLRPRRSGGEGAERRGGGLFRPRTPREQNRRPLIRLRHLPPSHGAEKDRATTPFSPSNPPRG